MLRTTFPTAGGLPSVAGSPRRELDEHGRTYKPGCRLALRLHREGRMGDGVVSRRVLLMAHCRNCGRRFSTGIITDADSPYRVKGWNRKCPFCATEHSLNSEDLKPAPILPRWQPSV